MEKPARTRFTRRGLSIDPGGGAAAAADQHVDAISGAMHYWRVHPKSWRGCLDAMKSLGLGVVETYVPWAVHETRPGSYDFTRERDLGAFLDLVADAGMHAIVRPGPHINAELTYFGFPKWIVANEAMQARTSRDTPVWLPAPPRMFPVPSYASREFRAEVEAWMAAVGEVVAPRRAPDGPVVAAQVDNEAQMFFRVGAYDHDYHPDAIEWWRDHAGDVEPPRAWDPDDAERCVEWVRFKEVYVGRALGWVADAMRAGGMDDIALFHNLPPTDPRWTNLPELERAIDGVVGIDFYHTARDYAAYRRRALYLAGSCELPSAPELGMGGPPWLPPMSVEDQKSVTLGVLSAGVRSFNLYMTVDRERWYGAPIDSDGATHEPAAWMKRLLTTLREVGWTELRRDVPVAVILSRADARFASASSVADPLSPVLAEFLGLGPAGAAELSRDEDAMRIGRWLAAIERALCVAQIPYEIVDEACDPARLERYRAVVLPTLDRVDRALWRALHDVAKSGVQLIAGPGRPSLDEYGQPLGDDAKLPPHTGLIQEASIDDLEGLADDLTAVAGELSAEFICVGDAEVDCSLFEDAGGEPRLLFVANRSRKAVEAEIAVPAGVVVRDPLAEVAVPATAKAIKLRLAPSHVRLLQIDGR